jgi:hypothetical protein
MGNGRGLEEKIKTQTNAGGKEMYTLTSSCQLLIHLVLKHPILTVAMGVIGATIFLAPVTNTTTGEHGEWDVTSQQEVAARIQELEEDPGHHQKMEEAEKWFQALLAAGKGDPGMTEAAMKNLERYMNRGDMGEYPECPVFHEILESDKETRIQFARIYFYDQMKRFENPELALLAFRFGPTNIAKMVNEPHAGGLTTEQKAYLLDVEVAGKDLKRDSVSQ